MTFQPTSLALFNSTPWLPSNSGIGFYCYATTDPPATVLAAGYFNAVRDKLKVNDIVDVVADADGGAPVLRLKVTAAPPTPSTANVTVEQIGGSVAPEATTFGVTGGNGHASVGGIAGAGTARVDVYRVPAGQTLDRDVHPRLICLAAPGAWAGIDGDGGVVNALAGAASLGRQWSLPGGKLTHVNTNLENRAAISSDGINWQSVTTPFDATLQLWNTVCWSLEVGTYAAGGGGGTANARAMTSPDGITWTVRTTNGIVWRDIVWSKERGIFAMVGNTANAFNTTSSPDGITWSSTTKVNTNQLSAVCWAPELGLFVACGATGTGNRVHTSPDGITWTPRTTPADNTWVGICWSPELHLLVAVSQEPATGGKVMTSPDGITWTLRADATMMTTGFGWADVCWSPERGRFVAVALAGTVTAGQPQNRVAWSPDGINWTFAAQLVGMTAREIIWVPELSMFVMVSSNSAPRTSPDGDFWTTRPNSPAANQWYGVCWSPAQHKLVAVAETNAINPEISNWNLAAAVGHKVRVAVNIEAVTGTGVQMALANPDRELLPAAPWTTTGVKITTLLPTTAAAWIGVSCPTNGTCTVSAPVAFLETPSCAPQGLFDYYAFPFSFSGIEGPAATPVLNVQIV